ncbi:MAG: FKBP-type peptidyl-prolyl cis-trans isomerase [Planctomycetota bacterium]
MIEGWNEGLLLMSPGARFKFTIPANLAYGEAGSPPVIPKNATLIFDVELLRIPERALPYVDWNEERGTTELDGGLKYQVLKAGEGTPAGEAKYVFLEFARYGADKKITLASTMTGMIVGPPSHPKLPFLAPLLKDMQAGTHCLVQVPKALDLQMPGAGDAESSLWQVVVKGALNCEKPSFAMPAEEELTTTASGLKYKVEREGFGKQPTDFNRCTVFYTGWLTDGTQFDSAYDRGQPATFGVTQVIKGWTEGLKLMSEGSKYTFVIPGDLAYGKGGSGAKIPPDATLVFTVELLQVQ